MSIYRTKTGYRVQVDIGTRPDGSRDRKTASCRTAKEARRAEIDLQMLKRDLRGRSNRITLSAYIDGHFLPDKEEILRKNTLAGYRRDIELRIRPWLGGRLIGDVTHSEIQRMLSACDTASIAENARDTLRCVLSHAVDNEVLAHNPAAGRYRMPPKESTRDRRGEWLTSFGEHRRVIGLAGDAETRALLVLGLCFGLRKGEILGLEWGHVDFGRREIHVRQTYTYTVGEPDMTPPKTRQSRRTVPMTDFAFGQMVALRDCGGVTRIAGPVADHGGRPVKPRRATTLIERFREAHDVPRINMSTLRHSFATAAIRAGIDVASVSKWLGHTDVTTTLNRYVRPLLTDLKEDAKAIDRAYARAANGT